MKINKLKIKRFPSCFLGVLALILLTGFPSFCLAEELMLTLGDQKTIEAPGVKRVSVGDPKVLDVIALENSEQILLTATGVGKTNLILWGKNNRERTIQIQVTAQDVNKVIKQVRELLADIEGTTSRVVGEKVIIEGYVLSENDLGKIAVIRDLYPQVTSFASLSPAVLDTITSQINREFKSAGLPDIRAERIGKQILLQGHVKNKEDTEKANMIATSYFKNTKNFIKKGIELEKMLLVSIDFIEVDKDAIKNFGVDWADSATITANAIGSSKFVGLGYKPWEGTYGLIGDYSLVINAVKSDSNSRILAQPKLLCRSGRKAEFLAGGEVGIPLITQNTSSVEYKKFGLILNIAPSVDKYGNIATSIEVENSQISNFVNGIPNFTTSRVKTDIYVKAGETVVLSGLVSNVSAKGVEKIPFFGSIPIIGELFKSRNFRDDRSELLIFVTPEILLSNDEKNREAIAQMQEKYRVTGEKLKFKLMD